MKLAIKSRMLVHEIYLTLIFAIFRIFDKDNDGFLTTDELRKIMKGRMSKRDLELMIKEADSDNDGFINCKGKKTFNLTMNADFGLAENKISHTFWQQV